MPQHRSTRVRAFTLIELLVVIAIIALLIGILLPVLSSARASARTIKCSAQLRDIGIAVQAYEDDFEGDLPIGGFNDPIAGWTNNTPDGKIVRWPNLVNPYYGREDRGNSSSGIYDFEHYKCPENVGVAPNTPVGIYGYNVFFRNRTAGINFFDAKETWRSKEEISNPSELPLFGDVGTEDLDNSGDAGGLSMDYKGPHALAKTYGWDDVTDNVGPSPNHNGSTNYLFADGHVETEGEIWPWDGFEGNSFHPKGNWKINPDGTEIP